MKTHRTCFATIIGWISSIIIVMSSGCKKIDIIPSSKEESPEKVLAQFFNVSEQCNSKVKSAADYLLRKNVESEFVSKAVKNAGYPLWDKAKTVTPSHLSRMNTDTDSAVILYIPFVSDSSTTAILTLGMNSTDTVYKILWPQQYAEFGFDSTGTQWSAEQLFMLFTEFDYEIYNHRDFVVPDGRIFGRNITDTIHISRIEQSNQSNQYQRSNSTYLDVCANYAVNWVLIALGNAFTAEPGQTGEICIRLWWFDNANSTFPPLVNYESWEPPAPEGSSISGGAWYWEDPEIWQPYTDPNDSLWAARLNGLLTKFKGRIDSVHQTAQQDGDERAFTFGILPNGDTALQYILQGDSHSSDPNLFNSSIFFGHTHQDDDSVLYKNQSFDGVDHYKLFYSRIIQQYPVDGQLVTTRDFYYAIVITIPTKFRNYIHSLTGSTQIAKIRIQLEDIFTTAFDSCPACSWQKRSEMGMMALIHNNNQIFSGVKIFRSPKQNINFELLTP